MRRIHIALPVIGLLLSGGVALAATGTSATSPSTHATTATHSRAGTSTTTGGKFASENEATKGCGGSGNVVWGNSGTKVYHIQGDKYFGHTKHGAFMCKSTATAEGFHAPGQKTAHKG